jgi:hypothetical protein
MPILAIGQRKPSLRQNILLTVTSQHIFNFLVHIPAEVKTDHAGKYYIPPFEEWDYN